jgi:hypothetical protein
MSTQLEDLVRDTLREHAPTTVRPADWATLRSRARRRSATGRATVVAGAAAVGALALTTPWDSPSVAVGPSDVVPTTATPQPPVVPTSAPGPQQPRVALDAAVVDTALTYSRSPNSDWSTGSATDVVITMTLEILMGSDLITDPTAQPQVIWASASHGLDPAQGPQVVVAVEQPDGWVVGLWSEQWGSSAEPVTFGTMPAGPITDRFVGLVIPDQDLGTANARHIVYVAPPAATRVVEVLGPEEAEYFGEPPGTEVELDHPFGDYAFSPPPTIRAYAADGTLLDEQTYDQ